MKQYSFDEIIPRENTNCVKYDLRKALFGKEEVIPMWVADMDFRTPDFILDAIRQRLSHEILGYTIRSKDFSQAIITWMDRRHQWKIQPGWISFSPGVVPAINMLVLALTQPGDGIIVQPPVYFPFFSAVNENGRRLIENPLKLENGRLCMDFDDLEAKAAGASMILISHPHNPGGSVWTSNELLRLAEICLKHKVLMVSDEIHSDLIFKPHRHIPLASLSEEIAAQTITCNAPSKTFNLAGLATAYLIIPNKSILDKYNDMLNDKLHLGMGNIFGAEALKAAYRKGDDWLAQLLHYVWGNIGYVVDFCNSHLPQIKPVVPESTYMIWLDCKAMNAGSDELKKFFLQKAGIGLNEGKMFGTGGEGFMRMNVACPRATVEKAMHRIRDASGKII